MAVTISFQMITTLLLLVLLVLACYLIVEAILIAIRVRKLLSRVETVTDISAWWSILKRWPKKHKADRKSSDGG